MTDHGPYRTAAIVVRHSRPKRTISGRFRSLLRRFAVRWYGKFLIRYPVKCPTCNKRSWNPHAIRRNGPGLLSAGDYSIRANRYRCGHGGMRVGLSGMVRLG